MSLSFGSGPFGADPGVPPSMPPTTTVSVFAKALNYHDLLPPIVLTVPHAAGADELALPAGAGAQLGPLPPNRIFRVTALKFPGTTAEEVLGIYEATGIDVPGDTLTGLTGAERFGNVALPAGTTIEVRTTAKDLGEIQDAVNAAEATIGANTAALAGKQPLDADLTAIAGLSHAKGQLIADDGSAWVALAPGADSQVLTLDSTTAPGVKWATPAAGGTPGGSSGQVQFNDAGAFAGDDDLTWDATDKLLKVADMSSGRTYLGALPGFPAYGGVWIGQSSPGNTNYSLLGTGTSTLINDVNELSFNVANVALVNLKTACVAVGYGVTSSTADATTTMHVAAAAPGYKALVVAGAPGQTANLHEWRSAAGVVLASINAAGSLRVVGQAGEYPIEVTTPDGTATIFRVTNATGDVFGAGTYSSGVGFRATAFGAYVGVLGANRITFPSTSPSILANPLGASTSVFGVQGAPGQTANLQEWLDSTGAVLASVGPAGTFTLGTLGGLLKATSGAVSTATAGTDYLTPTGSGAGLTGIAGSQVSGDIAGNAANVTGTVAIGHGGTGQATAAAGFNALSPVTTTGDLIYGSAANTAGRLAGPTSATKQFLTSTGTGSAAQAPAWGPVAAADVSGLGTAATHPDTDFLAPTGSGAGLTTLNASALATGTVPLARLPAANGRLTATVTTTSNTLGTNALTNLGFSIGASEVWTVEWNLTVTGSTAGMKFDVTGPASPTDLRISIIGNTSAITATSAETIAAFSTASAAYVLYATTSGQVRIVACVNNGANAGTVQLRFGAATNTQSNSVLLNSYMTARRIG